MPVYLQIYFLIAAMSACILGITCYNFYQEDKSKKNL